MEVHCLENGVIEYKYNDYEFIDRSNENTNELYNWYVNIDNLQQPTTQEIDYILNNLSKVEEFNLKHIYKIAICKPSQIAFAYYLRLALWANCVNHTSFTEVGNIYNEYIHNHRDFLIDEITYYTYIHNFICFCDKQQSDEILQVLIDKDIFIDSLSYYMNYFSEQAWNKYLFLTRLKNDNN